MTAIKPMAETKETVTLKRADFEALLNAAEDAADLAAVEAHRAYEDRVGWETVRRNYLTTDEARRLLDGESPVRVWREKRGIKQRTLAEAAEVSVSYLAEIEGGKKPGSAGALDRIASVLEMPLELLSNGLTGTPNLHVVSRAEAAAVRLVDLAAQGIGGSRLAQDTHKIVAEWDDVAAQRGLQHQTKAAIEVLAHRVAHALKEPTEDPNKPDMTRALGPVLDALVDERDKR